MHTELSFFWVLEVFGYFCCFCSLEAVSRLRAWGMSRPEKVMWSIKGFS